MPAEGQAALGPEEIARRLAIGDAVEAGNLGAGSKLQVEISGQRATERRQRFVANLCDLPAAFGERDLDEFAVRIEVEEAALLVEVVERTLERDLPVVRTRFPVILGPADDFAEIRVAAETRADRVGPCVDEARDVGVEERLMIPMAQTDQLEPPRTETKLIVAVDVERVRVESRRIGARPDFSACQNLARLSLELRIPRRRVIQ